MAATGLVNRISLSQKVLILTLIMTAGALGVCFALDRLWTWTFLILIAAVIQGLNQRINRRWIANGCLLFFTLAAGRGLFLDVPPWLMLIVVLTALNAWDLDFFQARLKKGQAD